MSKRVLFILVGFACVVILVMNPIAFTVRYQEKALVVTFGKIDREISEAGLYWKMPWQDVMPFDARIRTDFAATAREINTRDKQNIIVNVFVNWRISDVSTYYNTFHTGNDSNKEVDMRAKIRLEGLVADAANIFSEYNFNQLVTLDKSNFKLPEVERGADDQGGMLKRLKDKVKRENIGVEILDIGINRMGVPDMVTEAVFERMREDRRAEIRILEAEGKKQASSILARARSEAKQIVAEAQAQARKIEGQGDAAAAEYYTEFQKNPELAAFLRKLETLRKTLNSRTTIILDNQSTPYELLNKGPEILNQTDK